MRTITFTAMTLVLSLTAYAEVPPPNQAPATGTKTAPAPAAATKKSTAATATKKADAPAGVKQLQWDDLVPPDYRPDEVLKKYSKKLGRMRDDDPEAKKMLEEIRESWNNAPLVKALDGKTVKLAGYVVPLEGDGKTVKEFLIVPYYGACVHVPPPPSNQVVHVLAPGKGIEVKKLFDIVWVTGTMHTESRTSALAHAGYTLNATLVEPY